LLSVWSIVVLVSLFSDGMTLIISVA